MQLKALFFSLLILISNVAYAQRGTVNFKLRPVNEGTTSYITASFLDENNNLVLPESVYYQILAADDTVVGAMNMCSSEGDPSPCQNDTDCTSGSCDSPQPYECSDKYCEERYFCRNVNGYCIGRCESGTTTPPTTCDEDSDCSGTGCTGGDCNCIGRPGKVMDLTVMPIATKIQDWSLTRLVREKRKIVVWFTYPDGCSGATCVTGSGEAEFWVKDNYGICVIDNLSLDGHIGTTCPTPTP